ncbi:hypothetical protein GE09DRAFT_1258364 [Coniochaeta sp. 2T2.1]|nr:hypothetical protein GE09DRAFT_1258364 [Coniochaeta sp. 2T2.1]
MSRALQKLKLKPFEADGFAFANCPAFEAADGKHLVALMRTHLGQTSQVHPRDIEGCLAATFDNAGGVTHLLRRGVVHVDFWLAVAQATDWTMRAQDLDVGALFAVAAYLIDGRCYAERAGVQPTGRLARAVNGFLRTRQPGSDDKWPDAADSDDEDGGAAGSSTAAPPSTHTFTVTLLPSRPVAAAAARSVPAAPVASAASLPSAPANNNTTTTATSVAPAAPVAAVGSAGAAPAPAGPTTVAALVPPLAAMRISRKRSNDDSDSDEQPATKLQRTK